MVSCHVVIEPIDSVKSLIKSMLDISSLPATKENS